MECKLHKKDFDLTDPQGNTSHRLAFHDNCGSDLFGDSHMYPCKHSTCPLLEIELISLTRGLYAIVDKQDFEWLSKWKWYAHKGYGGFYAARRPFRKPKKQYMMVYMHREILGLRKGDVRQGDHVDHNTINNCRLNLRICTQHQNRMNQTSKTGTSKYKGVWYSKNLKRWRACIRVNNKTIHLGCYKTEIEAALAYNIAAVEHFGEFAHLNEWRKG